MKQTTLPLEFEKITEWLDFLPIPAFLVDSNHQITWVNLAFCELMNFSPKDLIRLLSNEESLFESKTWSLSNSNGISLYFTSTIQTFSDENKVVYCTDITQYHNQIKQHQRRTQANYLSMDIDFKDLFDIKELQKLQDVFSDATGVSSVITYPNGQPITEPSNFKRLCRDVVRSTEKGRLNCFYSDSVLGRHNPEGALTQPCLSAGLLDGGSSISVGGKHVANWLIGQVRNPELDESKILAYAQEIGVDEQAFKEALTEIPQMSKEKFKKIADTLFLIANTLSAKAFQNIQQERLIKDLELTQHELIVAKEKSECNEQKLLARNMELLAAEEEVRATNEELVATADSLKDINTELSHAKEKAEESERLKTSFLQNMSHEIRTPMNAIIGFSDMLGSDDLSHEKRKNFVEIIISSSHQLLSIVNDILTVSSIETGQEKVSHELVFINSILIELVSKFSPKAKNQNIELYLKQSLPDKHALIYTDEIKLRQILTNLISNAIKFTHQGYVEFGYHLKGNLLEFYVKDTGIGIDSESHEKIFERFRQADASISKKYGGTGLGLSISKSFVELLGGKLWITSKEGEGSTFYFTLPYKNKTTENHELLSKIETQTMNRPTVLIAEDEQYNYLYIEELLKKKVRIIHAKNGEEAVEKCRENPDIAVVLMDIKMPLMSGFEANREIKKFRPDLPIIAHTAYALQHDIQKIKDEGFADCLTKPIHKQKVLEVLAKYIAI